VEGVAELVSERLCALQGRVCGPDDDAARTAEIGAVRARHQAVVGKLDENSDEEVCELCGHTLNEERRADIEGYRASHPNLLPPI